MTVRTLVRNALRMRPDRIIVGEVRGGEALDMLQAMNTGHEGSMSTAHANSAHDLLSRLETMALMSDVDLPVQHVREQIASALDLIVHVARLGDGRRVVERITVVAGLRGGRIELRDVCGWTRHPQPGFVWFEDEPAQPADSPTGRTSFGPGTEVPDLESAGAGELATPAPVGAGRFGRRPRRRGRFGDGWPGDLRRLGIILE